MHNDPQQELFSCLMGTLRDTYDVYDEGLPGPETDYPFIYMGATQQIDRQLKGIITGRVIITLHFWHNNPRQRGTLSQMMLDAKQRARKLTGTYYAWHLINMNQQILTDDSTDETLLHGVLELEFSFENKN